jgi:hypothetical protein
MAATSLSGEEYAFATFAKNVCRNCGQKGHLAHQCPNRAYAQQMPMRPPVPGPRQGQRYPRAQMNPDQPRAPWAYQQGSPHTAPVVRFQQGGHNRPPVVQRQYAPARGGSICTRRTPTRASTCTSPNRIPAVSTEAATGLQGLPITLRSSTSSTTRNYTLSRKLPQLWSVRT